MRVKGALKAALKLQDHARIEFDGDDHFTGFEKLLGEVSSTGTNFEDDIGALDAGFLDNSVDQQRVLEDVLAFGFVESDTTLVVVGGCPRPLLLLFLYLSSRHHK